MQKQHAKQRTDKLLKIKSASTEQYTHIQRCRNALVGHGGVQCTVRNLRKINKVWDGMRDAVRTFIANCPCCQKMSANKFPVNVYTYTTSNYKAIECLNIDFIGPFLDKGYILVIVDTLRTDLFEGVPLRTISTSPHHLRCSHL